MAKISYYYDTETCRYERVRTSKVDVILNGLGLLSICILFGFVISIVRSEYFPSQKELQLTKENEDLLFSYNLINKEVEGLKKMMGTLQERDDNVYRVVFEAEPIPEQIRIAGAGGSERYQDLIDRKLTHEELVLSTMSKVDKLKRQMYIQTKSYDQLFEMAMNKKEMLASIPAIRPVSDKNLNRFASGFGIRMHPILKVRKMHTGCDFSAPVGTPIYATGNGKVVKVERSVTGYGNEIEIDHGFGYITKYAHLSKFNAKLGDVVTRGQKIGEVGNTGMSVAPHLHYEVIYNGVKVDPTNFFHGDLTPEEYEILLKKAAEDNQSLGY